MVNHPEKYPIKGSTPFPLIHVSIHSNLLPIWSSPCIPISLEHPWKSFLQGSHWALDKTRLQPALLPTDFIHPCPRMLLKNGPVHCKSSLNTFRPPQRFMAWESKHVLYWGLVYCVTQRVWRKDLFIHSKPLAAKIPTHHTLLPKNILKHGLWPEYAVLVQGKTLREASSLNLFS